MPGQSGSGPIVIAFFDKGERIKFRSLTMPMARLHGLMEGAFRLLAALYPKFDVESAPTLEGFAKLQLRMTESPRVSWRLFDLSQTTTAVG